MIPWATIKQFLESFPIFGKLILLVFRAVHSVISWLFNRLDRWRNPTQKTFKFRQERIDFLVRDELMKIEANFGNHNQAEQLVIVRSEEPLEVINYNFAKRVYKNMRNKGIKYEYFFCYEDQGEKVVENVVKMLQTLSVVKLFSLPEQQEEYDKSLGWDDCLTDERRRDAMKRSFPIIGRDRDVRIAEIVEDNLKNIIAQNMSIYFISRIASEKFCIHKSSTLRSCYLAWNNTDYFIKLPQSEVERKIKAYNFDIKNTEKQGLFFIKTTDITPINNIFLRQLNQKFFDTNNLHQSIQEICFGQVTN